MNIQKISSVKSNNLKKSSDVSAKKASLPLAQPDSISFSGKTVDPTTIGYKLKKGAVRAGALLAALQIFFTTGCSIKNNMEPKNPTEATAATEGLEYNTEATEIAEEPEVAEDAALTKLKNDNAYQLAQKTDNPSITFDFTDNYAPHIIEPEERLVEISKEKDPDKYQSLPEILKNVYKIDEKDTEANALAAQAVVKANPWMAEKVAKDQIDYSGEVTNIPVEMILVTDFSADIAESKSILLPNVTIFVDNTENTNKTMLYDNVALVAKDADEETNVAEFKISKKEIEDKTDDEIAGIINTKLADAYSIVSMNSYAGQAIYHGIGIWEPNEEIFEKTSEKDVRSALLEYVKENQGVNLELPKISANVMIEADRKDKYGSASGLLQEKRTNSSTISYIATDRSVYDLSEIEADKDGNKTIRLLDILDAYKMPDGQSILQLYKSDKQQYKSLALAAARQTIDNDDRLQKEFGDKVLKVKDLKKEIVYTKEDIENENARINLQPVAVAIPDAVKEIAAPKVRKATYTPQNNIPSDTPNTVPRSSEPTTTPDPSKPTTTPDPTKPTTTPKPTTPTPTTPTPTTPTPTTPTPTTPTPTTPTPTTPTPTTQIPAPTVQPSSNPLPDDDIDPNVTTAPPSPTINPNPTPTPKPGECPEIGPNEDWEILDPVVVGKHATYKFSNMGTDPSVIVNFKDVENA